jgi:hypothetical protein
MNKLKLQIFRYLCIAVILSFNNIANSKDMPRYGVLVYSNLCTSEMSGDLEGNRITLRRLVDGDTLIYEYDDGSTHLVIADELKLDSKSGEISFKIHADGNLNTVVSGRFSKDGESLKVKGMLFEESTTFILKRVSDFSLPLQHCK